MRNARSIPILFALLVAALAFGAVPPGSRPRPARTPSPNSSSRNAAASPFRVGEKLSYQIGWMNLTEAATAELKVTSRRGFYGAAAWHFQAVAHTEDPLRMLMIVDDQFDSYCDAATLVTRQYELYLNEQDKRSVRKLALDDGAPGATAISAPAQTRDPLAILYRLRLVDWQRTPNFRSTIYDGAHFYRMVARLASAHDSVAVPAGKFDASRIAIGVSPLDSGGQQMQLTLWLANDPARTPLEVDAQVPVGTVKGQLLRIQR